MDPKKHGGPSKPSESEVTTCQKQQDLVYIHAYDNVIEKTFGRNENVRLKVLKSSIIGFSSSIKFAIITYKSKYV